MSSLNTSDIHLDNNPRNAYRWNILDWLEATANHSKVDVIIVCGDFFDRPEGHPASEVNSIVDFFMKSKNQWIIIIGNHDYDNPDIPFYRFLNHLDNVRWVFKPTIMKLPIGDEAVPCLLLPASKHWRELWPPMFERKREFPYVYVHATFDGTFTDTGFRLDGVPVNFFPRNLYGQIFAGDIHFPGTVTRRIERIGSPHRVVFGDTFTPRVIKIVKRNQMDLFPNMISRHVLDIKKLEDLDIFEDVKEDDQVKIRVSLRRRDFPDWTKIRRQIAKGAESRGWDVHGCELLELQSTRPRLDLDDEDGVQVLSAEDHVRTLAKRKKLDKADTNYGLSLLKGKSNG